MYMARVFTFLCHKNIPYYNFFLSCVFHSNRFHNVYQFGKLYMSDNMRSKLSLEVCIRHNTRVATLSLGSWGTQQRRHYTLINFPRCCCEETDNFHYTCKRDLNAYVYSRFT